MLHQTTPLHRHSAIMIEAVFTVICTPMPFFVSSLERTMMPLFAIVLSSHTLRLSNAGILALIPSCNAPLKCDVTPATATTALAPFTEGFPRCMRSSVAPPYDTAPHFAPAKIGQLHKLVSMQIVTSAVVHILVTIHTG